MTTVLRVGRSPPPLSLFCPSLYPLGPYPTFVLQARILALDAPNRVVVTARFDRPAGRVMVMQSSDASRYARGQAYRKKAKGINGMIVAIDLTQNLIVVDNDLTPH